MSYLLTELKQQESWLYDYHSKMLQMVLAQIDSAQRSLIALKKNGYPVGSLKFVRYADYRTFTYNQSGFRLEAKMLYLSKIGRISIMIHRDIPQDARIKQIVITKSRTSKWFACVTYDIDSAIPRINFDKRIGVDLGIRNFSYDSDGHTIHNPQNLKKTLKPLRRIQKKISRRKAGSANYKKAVRFYQKIHERITNKRKDFLHKASTHYARNYDVVFVEKLNKLNLVKNHNVARAIFDSGWGIFVNMLEYKCKMLVKIPAKNTTIDCSRCANKVPKSLATRIHKCDVCGLVIDRDENAAINILKKGLKTINIVNQNIKLPQELREVTPVEISKRSLKQEEIIGTAQ